MNSQSFTATIAVANSPKDVFNHIKDVKKWWGYEDFEGNSSNLHDEFIIRHGEVHYSKQQLIEVIPDKKMVWLVTESKMNWLIKDMYEWTNTKMIFEITTRGDQTVLNFTHEGLIPEKECYSECRKGWTMVIKERLYNVILTSKI